MTGSRSALSSPRSLRSPPSPHRPSRRARCHRMLLSSRRSRPRKAYMQHWFLTLAQDAPAAAAAEPESKSILEYIASGGPLSYVLVLVSFAAVSLVIRNLIIFSRGRLAPPAVFERLSGLLRENDI